MSSSSISDGGRKYKPLPPPKKQVTFASKRRSAKPASSLPTLNRKQSSLTQMQWVGTPREVIDVSSGEDDDDEYKEPPAKRRKQNGQSTGKKGRKTKLEEREAGQSSFTQVPYIARMKQARRSGVDDEGFQIWQDSEIEEESEAGSQPGLGAEPRAPAVDLVKGDSENMVPEIAESSQHVAEDDDRNDVQGIKSTNAIPNIRTPQKVRFVEVPSSQTPPSTGLSPRRSARHHRSLSRSPLKDRGINVQHAVSKQPSPALQNMSLKMLERTRFANQQARQKQNLKETPLDQDLEQCAAEATDELSLRTCPMPPPPPVRSHRIATVQDSQSDDFEAATMSTQGARPTLQRTGTIPDSQRDSSNETIGEDSQQQRPVRKLTRVATVQDSQFDDLDIEIEEDVIRSQHEACDFMTEDNGDCAPQSGHYPEGTYDPAFSALDRDATRFTWTQTQQRSSKVVQDSDTEDEDLDHGCLTDTEREAGLIPCGTSQEIGEPLAPLSKTPSKHDEDARLEVPVEVAPPLDFAEVAQRDDSANESGDQTSATQGAKMPSSPPPREGSQLRTEQRDEGGEMTHVPSSPPALRVSQISTVVPTQASMAPIAPSPRKPIKAEPFSLPPSPKRQHQNQAYSLLSSPQRPSSYWQPESLSSSPLPLPPWTSPEKHRLVDFDHGMDGSVGLGSEPQLDSLADFSLPPPPLLSSSRRQTPASSSL